MSQLGTNLKRRAAAWAGQLTHLAREYAPQHVRPAISSHVESVEEGNYSIHIQADRSIAPDARAWELGSGIHSKRGPKETYVIAPKKKKALAFFWDKLEDVDVQDTAFAVGKLIAVTDEGRGLWNYVNHPGIEAANDGQGYIAPAVKELRARARENLDEDIRSAITSEIRRSFGRRPE